MGYQSHQLSATSLLMEAAHAVRRWTGEAQPPEGCKKTFDIFEGLLPSLEMLESKKIRHILVGPAHPITAAQGQQPRV